MEEDCSKSSAPQICDMCSKSFRFKQGLNRHKRVYHNPSARKFSCFYCMKIFHYKHNLSKHVTKVHMTKVNAKLKKCPLCDTTDFYKCLLKHFTQAHGISVEKEKTFEFKSLDEFYDWLEDTETHTVSKYAKKNSYKIKNGSTVYEFMCHRSGYSNYRTKRLRHVKNLGSNKINGFCPAAISATVSETGCVSVKYFETHVGHAMELNRLPLSRKQRSEIAEKLKENVSFQQILDQVNDPKDSKKRFRHLTKKDLFNIKHSCNLAIKGSGPGRFAVENWVAELSSNKNALCLYKPRGVVLSDYPRLLSEDLVLITMTEAQSQLFIRYGHNCVCMDRITDKDKIEYDLVTLLIVDDSCQGFPFGFLISNRSDSYVLEIFLILIKKTLSHVPCPKTIMTDVDDVFYEKWVSVMGAVDAKLYCSWQVLSQWEKRLESVPDLDKRDVAKAKLMNILDEKDEATFNSSIFPLLSDFVADPDCEVFGRYFSYFLSNVKAWAFCHRTEAGLSCNVHLERIHKTLKFVFLSVGQKVRKFVKSVEKINKFVEARLYERKLLDHGKSNRVKGVDLSKRHKASLEIDMSIITKERDSWTVRSSIPDEFYTIEPFNMNCDCSMRCRDCNACVHAFVCSCPDSSIKWNMCKHIHSVCQFIRSNTELIESSSPVVQEENNSFDFDSQSLIIYEAPDQPLLIERIAAKRDADTSLESRKMEIRKRTNNILEDLRTNEELDIFETQLMRVMPQVSSARNKENNQPAQIPNSPRNLVIIDNQWTLLPKI